ncbi:hypothetical protein RZS08_55750, partial [Arthrospira platensis SPKY1]|nr:hypothetical protein [Arthrospira platensis SPKY1]
GLAISQRLVHLMGGTIHCFSRQGEGARFSVNIPMLASSEPYLDFKNSLEIFNKVEILIYSLNPVLRNGFRVQLSNYAIASRPFDDKAALERQLDSLGSDSPVLVVLDTPGVSDM